MKETFFNLPQEKRNRIIRAALQEFASTGYEKATLDAIVQKAGISKGGLYEYISSKEELFEYGLEYSYCAMYDYILAGEAGSRMPADPIARTRYITRVVVDFYLDNPEIIAFLVKASRVEQAEQRRRVASLFDGYFTRLYETCDYSKIRYEPEQIRSLLSWLLVKTRNDFTEKYMENSQAVGCRSAYLSEWEYFFSILTDGIYRGSSSVDNKGE